MVRLTANQSVVRSGQISHLTASHPSLRQLNAERDGLDNLLNFGSSLATGFFKNTSRPSSKNRQLSGLWSKIIPQQPAQPQTAALRAARIASGASSTTWEERPQTVTKTSTFDRIRAWQTQVSSGPSGPSGPQPGEAEFQTVAGNFSVSLLVQIWGTLQAGGLTTMGLAGIFAAFVVWQIIGIVIQIAGFAALAGVLGWFFMQGVKKNGGDFNGNGSGNGSGASDAVPGWEQQAERLQRSQETVRVARETGGGYRSESRSFL